jgi:hypothetical protein
MTIKPAMSDPEHSTDTSYFTAAFGTIARGAGMNGQRGKWQVT